MPTLGFLHTAAAHEPSFRALTAELDPSTEQVHVVDEDLLSAARDVRGPRGRHGVPASVVARLRTRVTEVRDAGADVVLCTCSTLAPAAEAIGPTLGVPVVRVDGPMAEDAVRGGGRLAVVTALATAADATLELVRAAAARAGTTVEVVDVRVPSAWRAYEAGDHDEYLRRVAQAAQVASGVDVVLLAQASMAGAAELLDHLPVRVVTSPRSAVERAHTVALEVATARS